MFKKQDDSLSSTLAAVIDWQESHPGSLTEDLCRMLTSSCTVEFRRQHTNTVLETYFKELREHLGPEHHPEITLDTLKQMFKRQQKLSAGYFLLETSLLTMELEDEPEALKEMGGRVKGILEDL